MSAFREIEASVACVAEARRKLDDAKAHVDFARRAGVLTETHRDVQAKAEAQLAFAVDCFLVGWDAWRSDLARTEREAVR